MGVQVPLAAPPPLPPGSPVLHTREVLFRGRIGEFGVDTVTLPNGVVAELATLRHPGAAAVVPLHADGTVTLLRQHRHAVGGSILEIPAGKLDSGEPPAVCARRELAEEAGLDGPVEPLLAIQTTPAFTDEVIHLFVARDLTPVATAREDDEVIETLRVPLAEAVARVERGEITDAKTVCALLLLARRLGV